MASLQEGGASRFEGGGRSGIRTYLGTKRTSSGRLVKRATKQGHIQGRTLERLMSRLTGEEGEDGDIVGDILSEDEALEDDTSPFSLAPDLPIDITKPVPGEPLSAADVKSCVICLSACPESASVADAINQLNQYLKQNPVQPANLLSAALSLDLGNYLVEEMTCKECSALLCELMRHEEAAESLRQQLLARLVTSAAQRPETEPAPPNQLAQEIGPGLFGIPGMCVTRGDDEQQEEVSDQQDEPVDGVSVEEEVSPPAAVPEASAPASTLIEICSEGLGGGGWESGDSVVLQVAASEEAGGQQDQEDQEEMVLPVRQLGASAELPGRTLVRESAVRQLPCPLCPAVFATETERKRHTVAHMEELVQCELCGSRQRRRLLPAHRATHAAPPHQCTRCQRSFDSAADLESHQSQAHGQPGRRGRRRPGRPRRTDQHALRPGDCPHCGRFIKVDLQAHINRFHTMVCPFECGDCGQRLVSRHALAEHRQVFHSEGFKCPLCTMVFSRKKQLSVHQWRKHGIGGVTCRLCGKKFARSDTLDTHMRCHERPLACQLCPARYPFKRELRNHEFLKHGLHGEIASDADGLPGEVYRCDKCGRCYGSWAARDRHRCRTGSPLTDLYVCQLCGSWSTRFEGDMVKHMRNLHQIEAETILIADVEEGGEGQTAARPLLQAPPPPAPEEVILLQEVVSQENVVLLDKPQTDSQV